ncbi:hypothetical protein BGX30_004151 [Mortierella sp. GBA39]|nr:hypothetical protein BGX30_004151 [Mortierella sp. GBA39]
MSDLCTVYKELLASNEGDILFKLKDGKQLKIISFLIKKRSLIFKTMLDLEAFREFMAHIYYNKQYAGSYVPLLFEILYIADYYEVAAYRRYISDRIIKLIANVPICLTIASEALKHGTLTSEIYARCVGFLKEAVEPQKRVCYDKHSVYVEERRHKGASGTFEYYHSGGAVDEQVDCIESSKPLVAISELPDFIVDDVVSVKIVNKASQQLLAIAMTIVTKP